MVLFIWLLCGIIGYLIGDKKNRPVLGLALGFLLGIFGIIIMLMVPAEPKQE
jgi:hypothetical protein